MDISKYGSGSLGTTNALRTLGKKAGAITLIGDSLKAVIAILLIKLIIFKGNENLDILSMYTGLGVVAGHNYPFWLKFKGGKGMAATGGVMATLDPWIIPVGVPLFVLTIALTRYVSIGSLAVAVLFPVWVAIRHPGDLHMLVVALVFMGLAFFQHRANIKRLLNGTENKLGQHVDVDNNKPED